MERIKGYDIPFDISKLKLRTNLIEQDGPLLSLYFNERGDYYIFYWLDCDERANRWMVLRVDITTLYSYLSKEIPLREVISNPADNIVWIIDIDGAGKQIGTEAIIPEKIPADYLPDKDSFFEFDNQQELLNEVGTDKFEIDIPRSDKGLFSELISKMGWKLSPKTIHNFIDKVAF